MNLSDAEKEASEIIKQGIVGAFRTVAWWILAGLIGSFAVQFASGYFDRDSTDTVDQRSNMRLHTDALTGCQYLSVVGGGITPRMGRDGQQMCGGHQ
jgi:hypothetical protein